MPRRRSPEQMQLWRLTIAAIRDIDALFARVAADIRRIVEAATSITAATRSGIMREIDRVLNRAFGLTQRAALTSELFRIMLIHTDKAAAAPFASMFERVEAAVMRRSPSLWGRIRLRLLQGGLGPDDRFARVYGALNGPVAQRQRILRSGLLDPQRRWVPKERWNTSTGYRLSDRGWKQGRRVRKNIDTIIREGMVNGDDPLRTARKLEQYLTPEAAPLIYTEDGRIIRRNMTAAPRSGHGSTWARRLMRTEVARMHGAATIEMAKVTPGVTGVQWLLSNAHADPDECTDNAERDAYGLGPGVYPPDSVPRFPNHPNDVCCLAPAVKSREAMVDDLVAKYAGVAA